tara:strand:+ start:1060 stop:1419 length:360 start_codon:yes stop_codon:yes gene_type:complete
MSDTTTTAKSADVSHSYLLSAWARTDRDYWFSRSAVSRLRKDFQVQVRQCLLALVKLDAEVGLSISNYEAALAAFNKVAEPIICKAYPTGDPYGRIARKLAAMKHLVTMQAGETLFLMD